MISQCAFIDSEVPTEGVTMVATGCSFHAHWCYGGFRDRDGSKLLPSFLFVTRSYRDVRAQIKQKHCVT